MDWEETLVAAQSFCQLPPKTMGRVLGCIIYNLGRYKKAHHFHFQILQLELMYLYGAFEVGNR